MTSSNGTNETGKQVAETWFSVEACANDVLRFREHHVDPYAAGDFWLLRGRERALLVDTGCGIVSPVPLVNAIAGAPVTAVALNCYYDHAGGWSGFDSRLCHARDAPYLLDTRVEAETISVYLNEETLWSLPWEGFDLKDYRLIPAEPTQLVDDGDIIDLGDRHLEVLFAPGREPGGIILWEEATGSLFTSDMLYDGRHGPAWPPPSPDAYVNSLERMRSLPVTCVYPGHYGIFGRERMRGLIDEQLNSLH